MSASKNLVETDPEKRGGTSVFYGTRVPIQHLFDCLETGESLDQFLEQFPTVTFYRALAVLEESKERLLRKDFSPSASRRATAHPLEMT